MPDEEEVQKALQVLQQYSVQRGDSFDIGTEDSNAVQPLATSKQPNALGALNMLNTKELSHTMGCSEKQAENLRALIVGGGTAGTYKLLSKQIGDVPAAVIGSLLSSYLVKKYLK
jgi:hypothetical protein